ncbi:hypothetical protein POUND7_006048 [Theobroma cacao]
MIKKLATLQTINHMTLLGPMKALIKQTKNFTIGLTTIAMTTGVANYKMFDYDELRNQEYHTPSSTSASRLTTPPTRIEQLEQQLLPSPINSQVARELFPECMPQKQATTSKGEESPTKKYKTMYK